MCRLNPGWGFTHRNARARIRKRLKRAEAGTLGDYRFVGDGVFEAARVGSSFSA